MELSKKILNIAGGMSMLLLSLSVFIYTIRDSKAKAAPPKGNANYTPIGAVEHKGEVWVIGVNNSTFADAKFMYTVHE